MKKIEREEEDEGEEREEEDEGEEREDEGVECMFSSSRKGLECQRVADS